MKARFTITFNQDLVAVTPESIVDMLVADGRIQAAIHAHGGDAIDITWSKRRDRKPKQADAVADTPSADNVVSINSAAA